MIGQSLINYFIVCSEQVEDRTVFFKHTGDKQLCLLEEVLTQVFVEVRKQLLVFVCMWEVTQ